MLGGDFRSKLRQLNSTLWVDMNNTRALYHPDFPMVGLYCGDKYTDMGVPQNYIPEYSILGVDGDDLVRKDYLYGDWSGKSGKWYDYDKIIEIKKQYPQIKTRILARGYRAILSQLVVKGYIDQRKAERLFNTTLEPQRTSFPARYIDLGY